MEGVIVIDATVCVLCSMQLLKSAYTLLSGQRKRSTGLVSIEIELWVPLTMDYRILQHANLVKQKYIWRCEESNPTSIMHRIVLYQLSYILFYYICTIYFYIFMLFFKVIYNLNRCITLRIVNSLCQQATYSCRRNPISYAVSSFTKNNSISSPKYVLRTVKNIYIGDSSKMFSKNLSTHTQIVNISKHITSSRPLVSPYLILSPCSSWRRTETLWFNAGILLSSFCH